MRASDRGYAHPIGVSLGDMTPPEQLGEKARRLEQLGYSHIMVPEAYFYVPALVGATLVLRRSSTTTALALAPSRGPSSPRSSASSA